MPATVCLDLRNWITHNLMPLGVPDHGVDCSAGIQGTIVTRHSPAPFHRRLGLVLSYCITGSILIEANSMGLTSLMT